MLNLHVNKNRCTNAALVKCTEPYSSLHWLSNFVYVIGDPLWRNHDDALIDFTIEFH